MTTGPDEVTRDLLPLPKVTGTGATWTPGPAEGEASDAPDLSITVGVRHASVEHAPYPLLAGHFAGSPLSGAMARLDERLDGRISRLQILRQFPRELGEILVLDQVDGAPPSTIVAIGLGPAGELTATELTAVVTRALLRLASRRLEVALALPLQPPPWPQLMNVSSVLIGSSASGGITVEASIRSLADAMVTANRRLRWLTVPAPSGTIAATEVVRFSMLELIERYGDRVDLMAAALDRFSQLERHPGATRASPVTYVPQPQRGEGATNADPPLDGGHEIWRRVSILVRAPDPPAPGQPVPGPPTVEHLEFSSIGRLARAEKLISDVETAWVDRLLADAITHRDDTKITRALYELLLPHELKGELNAGEHLHLLLDGNTARYPWELLTGRADEHNSPVPLALRVGVLRQFVASEKVRFGIRRASTNSILVVGNPPPGEGFLPLSGAQVEAEAVADTFANAAGWTTTALVWDTQGRALRPEPGSEPDRAAGESVLLHLLDEWRVIHIAAHGTISDDPAMSGVVLGAGLRLTANDMTKLSIVPDLVFLNACHLGHIDDRLVGANRLAASVAKELLGIGVRAVVAAGWAVNDTAASVFATTLYDRLLAGEVFGDAVFAARKTVSETVPGTLTWGAYQCYGDPGFRLVEGSRPRTASQIFSDHELRRQIQRLRSTVSDQGRSASADSSATTPDQELRDLEKLANDRQSYPALADLAAVYAEIADFEKASELYELAISRTGRDVPVEALEQLGNVLVRDVQRRHRQGDPLVEDDLADARKWLDLALTLGENGERLALLGSFAKRRAAMSEGPARAEHLTEAIRRYREADAWAMTNRKKVNFYYRTNWVQLVAIARLNGMAVEPAGELDAPDDEPTDFWGRATHGDVALALALRESQPGQPLLIEPIRSTYTAAFRLRSSKRERASVIDNVRHLADLAPPGGDVAQELNTLVEQLDAWAPGGAA